MMIYHGAADGVSCQVRFSCFPGKKMLQNEVLNKYLFIEKGLD